MHMVSCMSTRIMNSSLTCDTHPGGGSQHSSVTRQIIHHGLEFHNSLPSVEVAKRLRKTCYGLSSPCCGGNSLRCTWKVFISWFKLDPWMMSEQCIDKSIMYTHLRVMKYLYSRFHHAIISIIIVPTQQFATIWISRTQHLQLSANAPAKFMARWHVPILYNNEQNMRNTSPGCMFRT